MQSPAPPKPARHRLAAILVVAVYPVITALLYGITPVTEGWTLWQRTLLVAPTMVVVMVYALIPFVQRQFRSFLAPQA
jgi:antibiotic biosynthesis monooxygenase (ABM) superfamily enzyme